jgi:hypothetical protein
MATPKTFLYGNASQQFATAAWNWTTLTVWGLLVNGNYVPSVNGNVNVSDIPASAIIARVGPMTSKVSTNGVCSGVLPTFNALLSSVPAVAIILYVKGGTDATSPLIYYSADGFGFPFTPAGFNYAVANDMAQGGWFQV